MNENDTNDVLSKLFASTAIVFRDRDLKCNSDSSLNKLISYDIPNYLASKLKEDNRNAEDYNIRGVPGLCGTWCNVMYIAFLPNNNKPMRISASYGAYPCYLFSRTGDKIFLAYILGTGIKTERYLINSSELIANKFALPGFDTDKSQLNPIDDRHRYKYGTIFYKEYNLSDMPNDVTLLDDLYKLIDYHNKHRNEIAQMLKLQHGY